jgi:hypothetical protein
MRILLTLCVLFILSACNGKAEEKKEVLVYNDAEHFFSFLSTVKLPQELSWCGERVPLEIEEVRERAEREFYLMLQQPGQVILYLKRSGRYFPVFEKILKEKNMPDDLKYLSVAESALYMSRSSKEAVGLWQFIPSTGRLMGLIINDDVDERRNIEKSTHAAMKYLKAGFDAHKSWFLAAAGYNMGHGNLGKHLSYQSKENVFDLFMNEETSRYILRIAIIKELMQNSERYGFKLAKEDYYKPDKVNIVEVSQIENIAKWAEENGTTYKYVRLLNPWILSKYLPKHPKGSTYEVAIPEGK